jgi:hypothetical protein
MPFRILGLSPGPFRHLFHRGGAGRARRPALHGGFAAEKAIGPSLRDGCTAYPRVHHAQGSRQATRVECARG